MTFVGSCFIDHIIQVLQINQAGHIRIKDLDTVYQFSHVLIKLGILFSAADHFQEISVLQQIGFICHLPF